MKTDGFVGMNNVKVKDRTLGEPSLLLNAHVDIDGSLEKREGIQQVVALPGSHSLWTNEKGTVLCMAKGDLYRVVDKKDVVLLASTGQPDSPVSYLVISGLIYISNRYWTGIYDPATDTIENWGAAVPDAPILMVTAGSLPAGKYMVCMTVTGPRGRPSGNGSMTGIELTEAGGISILNLPPLGSAWVTDPNGSQFYYSGTESDITALPFPDMIPTLWGSPPKPMTCLCYAFGRVWGGCGSRLYYSEPFQPELFKLGEAYFEVGEPIGNIAKTNGGLFVGCKDRTFFFAGVDPGAMVQREAGPGVVPGSLCYANDFGEMGRNVPIWIGTDGVYAGNAEGHMVNLIKNKITMSARQEQGASIYNVKNGQTRMMFSYQQGNKDLVMGDNAACEIIRNGSLI